jgi:radical SAM protein with 4Fe4S-binding SPASM domain
MVSAGLNGSSKPCATRLTEEHILALETDEEKVDKGWARFVEARQGSFARESLFSCSGGRKFFFVDPAGGLALCPFDQPVYDLREGSLLKGWQGAVRQRRERKLPETHPCRDCADVPFCGVCPPVARMETGNELGWPRAMCELGKRKSSRILTRLGNGNAGDFAEHGDGR